MADHHAQDRPGGPLPVFLADTYNGRHFVLRKIGHGQNSTVWLVRDLRTLIAFSRTGYFRDLKILSSDCCGVARGISTRNTLTQLRDANPQDPGYAHIAVLTGCMKWLPGHRLPPNVMRLFTRSLLLALSYAHGSEVKYTDIKPENIFAMIKNKSVITDLYIPNNPNGPMFDIVLGGWGAASWADLHYNKTIRPIRFRPPESLIIAPCPPSSSMDFWSLGATMVEAFFGVWMFEGSFRTGGPYGPIPDSLREKGDHTLVQQIFDDRGRVKGLPRLRLPTLENASWMLGLGERDRVGFATFLISLMRVNPEERVNIGQLIYHPWVR
ncbi:CMGC/SRPK protein kinase [Aspergillus affinis]|uniref:CMGC/SRPK protein kinase n=1 Tax=Aspergillus affinis TaxID=1070780 RepID=UPI0022FE7C17|nr:CMGC/SRPK protein kinase [Aspergillus affinis]KAI9042104.1 CMGC/SRPK protein kinase [Aspergillus affinis]